MWDDDEFEFEYILASREKFRDVCVLFQTAMILLFGFGTVTMVSYAFIEMLGTPEMTVTNQSILCIGLALFLFVYAIRYPWGIPEFSDISDEYDDYDDDDDGDKEDHPEELEDHPGDVADTTTSAKVISLAERKIAKR